MHIIMCYPKLTKQIGLCKKINVKNWLNPQPLQIGGYVNYWFLLAAWLFLYCFIFIYVCYLLNIEIHNFSTTPLTTPLMYMIVSHLFAH